MSQPEPTSRTRRLFQKLRPLASAPRSGPSLLSKGALTAVVALVNSMMPHSARSQTVTTSTTTLPEVEVTGSNGYRAQSLSSNKYPASLLTTPQSAQVVTPELREDRVEDTLADALRNVSGISLGAGEGSYQGNNFSIRGFNSASDIFVDGMRDFGSYYRDPFNIEDIDVLKGPSSTEFGRGSTGGAVNMVTKTPQLDSFVAGSTVYGTDETYRGTLDVNEPIPFLQGSAFRLNAMGNENNVTDRNDVYYDRFGLAPSVAFGLDTPTRIILSYFHQEEHDNPDYGIPWVNDRPAPVPRNAFYGFTNDYFRAVVNTETLTFEHDFTDDLTVHEQLRVSNVHRTFRVTQGQLDDPDVTSAEIPEVLTARIPIDGESNDRDFDEDINLTWKAHAGIFENKIVGGFEYVHDSSDPRRIEPSWAGVPYTSLVNPNQGNSFSGSGVTSILVNGRNDSYSGYLIDNLQIGKQWTVIGGVREDSVSSFYGESLPPVTSFVSNNTRPSWRGALVYQPVPEGSFYFAAGKSFHPNVQQLSLSNEPTLVPRDLYANQPVGENTNYELGTKWNLFDNRLSASAAVFWDEQTNPATEDADEDLLYVTDGRERVVGVEFDAAGRITNDWQVWGSFSYNRGVVVAASPNALSGTPSNLVGNAILNDPRCTFSLWTTYNLPWNLEVGLGADGVGARAGSETPDPANGLVEKAPGYVLVSAMLKYQINSHVDIQANVTNLMDQAYYESVHPGHIVPGEGRTFFLSTNFKF